ncbi:MAG: 2-hydroxyacid dehydrogenase [Nitrospirales bacterium]
MSKPSVLLTRRIPEDGLRLLKESCSVVMWNDDSEAPCDWVLENISEVDGLLCLLTDNIDSAVLAAASRLRVVSTLAVGFDNISIIDCTNRGIPVGHTPGVLTETTADFAFALMMSAARRVGEAAAYVKQGHWKTWSPTAFLGHDLHGATLGIIGLGRIGRALAKRAHGFAMKVLACRSSSSSSCQKVDCDDVEYVDLHTLLAGSDFVSLHVPLTNETKQLIGLAELRSMKTTAILINTARGAVVDSQALYEALVQGEIAYAALDVTDPEPLPSDDPLLTLSNCLIVPHIASASIATRAKMAVMAAENLLAGLSGARLPYCANPEVYG